MRTCRNAVLAVVFLILSATSVQAQYFGQNKVQWESFDFKTLRTEHFDIYYYSQEADVVNDIGRMAERWYARLSRVFGHSFARKPIVLYANPADFHQTTTTGGFIGEGTGGFTDAFMNRVVLPLTGDYAENDHVLGHEIVHVFQYDIAANAQQNKRRFNLENLPLWLVEGMAEYFSKGRIDPLTAMWIRDATINDRLPNLQELTRDPRYFPYRYGQALLAYIGARFGDDAVVRYFLAAGTVGIEEAFPRAIGISSKQLFTDWQESSRELYNPVVQSRTDLGNPIIGQKPIPGESKRARNRRNSELNVGPAISPDGRFVAFISARDLFSIDIFLADAHTGKVIRRLVGGDRDAHFEALAFIESGGAFSPDGKRLAFITFAKGDNYLALVDVDTRKTETIRVPNLDAITSVEWSPDGRSMAISGQITGVSDLFLYNLDTKELRRLTNDKYADLQPAFSPDGRTIAFVTDRGSGSSIENLEFSDMKIATVDVGSGDIHELPLFAHTRHINPQYAPNGDIVFIANPEGIPDVYRYRPSDGSIARITAVKTGVSGITDMSPAMTVAAKTGDIALSLYEGDNYNIYVIPANAPATVVASDRPNGTARGALLPPLRGAGSEITAYLNAPNQGLLASSTRFEERRYDPALHLAYLGPPTIGATVGGPYGAAVGGTVSAYFTDILGQHNVGFTFVGGGQSTSNITDQLAGELFYLNQKHRVNWGADLVHVPYINVAYGLSSQIVNVGGSPTQADIYTEQREIQTVTNISGLSQYPFSATRRIEAAAGVELYSDKIEQDQYIIVGDTIIDRQRSTLPGSFSLNLVNASAAFVGDSSVFGFISPVRGTRYRYEVEALQGDLKFNTITADWRKYWYMRPVTFAVRGLHYGRYGQDAESPRLSPLYLGQGSLVRGYDPYSFNVAAECPPVGNICPTLDRLIGSRVYAGSVEVRAPLFGVPGYGLFNASFLPTEMFAFGDVGAAATQNQHIHWTYSTSSLERTPVFSVGAGLRILLSYIPIELYVAKPFQRPTEDVIYGFNIAAGW